VELFKAYRRGAMDIVRLVIPLKFRDQPFSIPSRRTPYINRGNPFLAVAGLLSYLAEISN
jgi:hypothetical protein